MQNKKIKILVIQENTGRLETLVQTAVNQNCHNCELFNNITGYGFLNHSTAQKYLNTLWFGSCYQKQTAIFDVLQCTEWVSAVLLNYIPDTNLLVPSRQFGHEQAVRRSGLMLSVLSVDTDATGVFTADASSSTCNNRLSVHTGDDCFLTTVHLALS